MVHSRIRFLKALGARALDVAREPSLLRLKAHAAWRAARGGYLWDRIHARLGQPGQISYADWLRDVEPTLIGSTAARLESVNQTFSESPPLISLVVPVWNPNPGHLQQALESLHRQVFPHWEARLINSGSSQAGVHELLDQYAASDPRFVVTHLSQNQGISTASNLALEQARGEFVALLDHDDLLADDALLTMAEAIESSPEAALFYSDEDKLNSRGQRTSPHFKPDFDAHLLLAQNYIGHLVCLRTRLARDVGGFCKDYDGAQDHDLLLRCTEALRPQQVVHIPRVLYHWRMHPNSTALDAQSKGYAQTRARAAVQQHLERTHTSNAEIHPLASGCLQLRFVPKEFPHVTIIIPTRDRGPMLRTCVESVLNKTRYPNFDVLVVDNQTQEVHALEYLDTLRNHPKVSVTSYDAPFNYADMHNKVLEQVNSDVLCLLNNDTYILSDDWLTDMVGALQRPQVGAVGATLIFPNGRVQHRWVVVGLGEVAGHAGYGKREQDGGYLGHLQVAREVSAVTAACIVTWRRAYHQVSGMDAENLPINFNDVDYCLKLREAGYKILTCPTARLCHLEGITRGSARSPANRAAYAREAQYFVQQWQHWMQNDPAYNVNLDLTHPYTPTSKPRRGNASVTVPHTLAQDSDRTRSRSRRAPTHADRPAQ